MKKYDIDFDSKIFYVNKSGYKSTDGNWLAQPYKGLGSDYNSGPSLGFIKNNDLLTAMTNPLLSSTNISIVKEKYINIEKSNKDIVIKTDNGNNYHANLFIVADGMNSIATNLLSVSKSFNDHLKYRGYEVYRGHTSSILHFAYKERISEDAFQTWGPGIRFATVPTNEGNAWFLAINKSKPCTDSMKGSHRIVNDEGIKKLLEAVKHWHRPVQDLIMNSDKYSTIVCDAYGSYHPSNRLSIPLKNHSGGIVFLGDASYTLDPILAQGAGLAVEHGYLLAKAINANNSNWNQALKHYDNMRIKRQLRLHYLSDISQFIGTVSNTKLVLIRNQILTQLYTRCTTLIGKIFDKIIEMSTYNPHI